MIELKLLSSEVQTKKKTFIFSQDECYDLFKLQKSEDIAAFLSSKIKYNNGNLILPIKRIISVAKIDKYRENNIILHHEKVMYFFKKFIR